MLRDYCTYLGLTILFCTASAFAEGPVDEPYTVYVFEDGGFAHCGPSKEHYQTDVLNHGDALDVYLETEDGWLGIPTT